jgi:hypothetical protein
MLQLKSALLALAVFAGLLPVVVVFWTVLLGPVMAPVWRRLSEGWGRAAGAALLVVAVVSGLAVYFAVLARTLEDRLRLPPGAVRWHLATTGLLPPVLAVAAAWLVVANMRIGW